MFNPFADFLSDTRYRNERILLLAGIPVAILLLAGLGWLLITQKETTSRQKPLLTADQIPDSPKPKNETPLLDSAAAAIGQNRFSEAQTLLEQALADSSTRAKAAFLLGTIDLQNGDFPAALSRFSQAAEWEPSSQNYFSLSEAHRHLGDLPAAITAINSARSLEPSSAFLSNARYLYLIENGNSEQVEADIRLKDELGLVGTLPSWILARAALDLQNGNFDRAAALLSRAKTMLSKPDFFTLVLLPPIVDYSYDLRILPFCMSSELMETTPANP